MKKLILSLLPILTSFNVYADDQNLLGNSRKVVGKSKKIMDLNQKLFLKN